MSTATLDPEYELFYWPHIQGRGEFVRLVLEYAGAEYRDVARLPEESGGGSEAIQSVLASDEAVTPSYAPPVLRREGNLYSQTASICALLGAGEGLAAPGDENPDVTSRTFLHANQLQLTMQDFLTEIHDTHHPISVAKYYDEQRESASRRAEAFREDRLPKFLDYFERTLEAPNAGRGPLFFGNSISYPDLSMFQIVRGLRYAFPNAVESLRNDIPNLRELDRRVEADDAVAEYLESDRRIPFNEQGIFRHYPELDAD